MANLRLALLGTPAIRHADATLTFPTRKALALLVYLAVEGGRHSRDKLATLFWPDSDRQHGRAMLRYTLTSLRHVLDEHSVSPHLRVEGDSVELNATSCIEIDLDGLREYDRLADLERAVGLWRGEFLEGFALADAPDFDEWASVQREDWRQKMEHVLDRLSEMRADRGELADAIGVARRWVALNPLNEKAHRRLMAAHVAAGDRNAALRAYEGCRAVLEKELRVAPAPATQTLAERIRSTDPIGGGGFSGTPAARSGPPAVLEPPLVGRSDEFLSLVQLYHAVAQGRSTAVLLLGEAGIGKTRLAQDFLAWAAGHGGDVLAGRAFETGGRLPFQPLVDALRPRLERENAPEDLLSDVWLTELARLLPELRDRYPDLPVTAGDEAVARTRLFEAIARLGEALALQAPVVLLVDDVQWADAGSLDALHYLGRRWRGSGSRLLLLLCLRSEALAETPALDDWLLGLRRDLAPVDIALGPLTLADTLQLVQGFGARVQPSGPSHALGPEVEQFAGWLFSQTSGQPFFAVEIIRELLERHLLALRAGKSGELEIDPRAAVADPAALGNVLPAGIREVIRSRLAHLARPARELLTAGAVLGQGFTFEQVLRVAALSEDEALPALDAVASAHLLREVADERAEPAVGTYFFTHDKIRDVVYAEAGDARQRVFHRRALEVLQATAPAAELAGHALAAGVHEAAVRYSVEAGDAALRLLASRDALVQYERALGVAERLGWTGQLSHLRARRGRAYSSLAAWPEARRELELALNGLGPDQHERRAEVLVDLLEVCWWLLDTSRLRQWAAEALGLAVALGRGDLEVAARGWLAASEGADGDVPACVAESKLALARGRQLDVAPPATVHTYLSLSLYWLGRMDDAIKRGEEGVQAARQANHTTATMWSLPHLGLALAGKGRYEDALKAFEEARRFGREYGVDTLLARAISMSAGFHLDVWDLVGHQALAEEARELARSLGFPPPAVSAGIDLLLNFARQQAVGRAEPLLEDVASSVAKAAGWHGWLWSLRLAQARAELALARGDAQDAVHWAGQAIEQSRGRRRVKYEVLGLTTRAQALAALGRTRAAIADLRRAAAAARPVGDPALYLRPLAELVTLDGDDTVAADFGIALERVTAALPQPEMRRRFELAEPIRGAVQAIANQRGRAAAAT